ncbi:hypothetical protein SKAU_G00058140 [Synaphobranchus kaupii]|uniref:Gypsy retrotransposon integrase-like protein 1 n=1 Tax=Synaphobranchus kaupii TaxID=118154 RepID=A0A9Q1G5E7_SYNKA|nr:hypothetical protein SKAU_G00058140 [Synaphobranchus kaupii]
MADDPPARPAAMAGPCATFNIQPPEPFDFTKPHEWEKWIRRFERFRQASNLHTTTEENQVNTLVYCMGSDTDDVLKGLNLSAQQQQQYAACNYGVLHEELIRDRLVVGLSDLRLSERMQLDKDLTLAKAIEMARQTETVRQQQSNLRGDTVGKSETCSVDRVMNKGKPFQRMRKHAQWEKPSQGRTENTGVSKCFKCGKSPSHPKVQCPANDVMCHSCGKKGHYRRVCASSRAVHEVQEEDSEDDYFLGTIATDGDPWMVKIKDRNVTFKMDTGADVTVIPDYVFNTVFAKDKPALRPVRRPLLGPGRTPLDMLGFTNITLRKRAKQKQEDVYVVRGLHTALLSRPACEQLGLVARVGSIDIETMKNTYPKLCSGLGLMQRPYTIKLVPDAVPFSLKTPRRVPLPLLPKVKRELERMERIGVISRVEEPTDWCSGMVVVPKKTGDPRICVDLTRLNVSVRREKYILPSVEQTLGSLAGARIFSKLDCNMGFWQIPLAEESAKLTTFITPFGRFQCNRLPFGIASAPEHFQNRMTTEVIDGLGGVVCHMDDVLVWGHSQEEHDSRLHAVLARAEKAGITLNMEKCELSRGEVKFLGHVISAAGVKADPGKTAAVREIAEPSNTTELRSFLGMVNQLGKFIPQLSEKDKPLRDLLSKKNHWFWGPDQAKAFDSLKEGLTKTPVLALYDPNRDIKVSADASSFFSVAYAHRFLSPVEQRYAQVEKEALGLTWACERFKDFLIGLHFALETDHKPLVSLLGAQALETLPPRIQRFRMRLMRYSYTVSHIPGRDLWTADALSRAPLRTDTSAADRELLESTNIYVDSIMENVPASASYIDRLREHLATDGVCSKVMRMCQDGWPESSSCEGVLRLYWAERAFLTVHDSLLLKGMRLVIPAALRSDVLSKLHEGHQGVAKCRERARQSVWWPGLSQQLNELVLNCRMCIQERTNHTEPLIPTELPERPWQKPGADIFTLKGKMYLLVVDYYSRYVEIANLTHTKSTDITAHLKSMFARHGVPETLMTDNGPQFSGGNMLAFAAAYGFKHVTCSPHHPQSNGEAERAVQTVKNLLKKAADPYLALLAYRATPLHNGFSPAQLLMGRQLRSTVPTLPSLLDPALPDGTAVTSREMERRSADQKRFNRRHRAQELSHLPPGKQVWVTDAKVTGTMVGDHSTPRSYVVDVPHGTVRRNRHHLIPMDRPESRQDTQVSTPTQAAVSSPVKPTPEPSPDRTTVRTRAGRAVVKPQRLDFDAEVHAGSGEEEPVV